MSTGSMIILGIYGVASLATLATYGWDKRCAQRGRWRVPERWLHGMELLGGWPGGLAGQRLFRHKNRKGSYQVVFWGIVLLHAMAWTWVYSRTWAA